MNFSVVLIARNEEKTLPRLLASLSEFRQRGGEIILVDTGSTDGTVDVAEAHGVYVREVGDRFRFILDEFQAAAINEKFIVPGEAPIVKGDDSFFDYSAARNFAASLAKNDMVSMPDCDEAFTKLDLDKVNAAIAEGYEQLEYQFVFSHDTDGRPAIQFLHSKFYNRQKLRWVGVIHEVLSGNARRARFEETAIKLEHYQNHETDRSHYLRGLALDVFRTPDNDRNSHYFGRELLWTKRPLSAIRELERHVAMNRWPAERSQSLIFIGDAKAMLGDTAGAVRAWQDAFNIEAGRREPLIRLADHYARQGDALRANVYATASLEIAPSGFYADDMAHYRHVPHEILAWAKSALGDQAGAVKHAAIARSFHPDAGLPLVSILVPHLGRPEGLERLKASIEALDYPAERIEVLIDSGEGTVPQKVERMRLKATGSIFCYAANDMEFEPSSLRKAVDLFHFTGKELVAFGGSPVLPDIGNVCEHFIITRNLATRLGGIFDIDFHHVGVDNLLWAKATKLEQAIRCEEAIVRHHHFSQGAVMDETYQKGWQHVERDRALLKEKLAAL